MSKIIPLDEKLKLSVEQKAALLRKKKLMALRRAFQCAHCASKCERCGKSLEAEKMHPEAPQTSPYRFCGSCREEYADYIQHLQGKGDPEAYWHNHDWLKAWQAWIAYQGAIDSYLRSRDFRRLIEELGPGDLQCD